MWFKIIFLKKKQKQNINENVFQIKKEKNYQKILFFSSFLKTDKRI